MRADCADENKSKSQKQLTLEEKNNICAGYTFVRYTVMQSTKYLTEKQLAQVFKRT